MSEFRLTDRQQEAQEVLASDAQHIMLFGGSRSGKTFLLIRNVVMRALKAKNSRHAVLRFRFNACKQSIVLDTFPKVLREAFPGVKCEINRTDWYAEFENGSQIFFGGLDDKERTEKILGMEFSTVYFNECSQIPYGSIALALTRLAQRSEQTIDGRGASPLKLRAYYDCNPPSKAHWAYRLFVQKQDPEERRPVAEPENYRHFKINPADNVENIAPEYMAALNGMSERMKRRFRDGNWGEATPNALFPEEVFDRWRVVDGKLPDLQRIVVAVDPSGASDDEEADNDAIGIAVVALGIDGNGYVLEDATIKAGPGTWGKVAASAYDRHGADCCVGEINYGGAMVEFVVRAAKRNINFKMVTATRGKVVRAEPVSALYEDGKVRHVGYFPELEEEFAGFNTTGYTGANSPNRADAVVWAITELFPRIVAGARKKADMPPPARAGGWMG